ncbi:hypothetical protein GCM10017790_61700 [Amycolatopsis oliviviridis]|uniref:Uncharacterized protein n=1 Tax=Amycolatopsis oliviviridis TaxID=1471590 RepID=A0ABQ3LYJ7_9PSEU|nr:hypothetical protein GCM10017790_61700 [Amycolatopsis oliviviridis]
MRADRLADQPRGAVERRHPVEGREQLFPLAKKPAEHRAVLGGEVFNDVPSRRHALTIAHRSGFRTYPTGEGASVRPGPRLS